MLKNVILDSWSKICVKSSPQWKSNHARFHWWQNLDMFVFSQLYILIYRLALIVACHINVFCTKLTHLGLLPYMYVLQKVLLQPDAILIQYLLHQFWPTVVHVNFVSVFFCCASYPSKAYWLHDAPTGLTLNNCTFCPHCICVFCIYLRINSDFCSIQHNWLVFITKMKSVYCTVWTGSLNKAVCALSLYG